SGEVTDQEDHTMPELLKVLHLPDDDRMPKMDVGRGRIEPDLDREGLSALDLRLEVSALDEIDGSLREVVQLFVEGHGVRIVRVVQSSSRPVVQKKVQILWTTRRLDDWTTRLTTHVPHDSLRSRPHACNGCLRGREGRHPHHWRH